MPATRSGPLAPILPAAIALVLAGCQREAAEDAARAPRPQPAAGTVPLPETEPRAPPVAADIRQTFQCGERRVEAHFAPDGVLLDVGGRQLPLPRTHWAPGARYGDGDPEFRTGMDAARLTLDGETADCTALDDQVRSPWSQARERDVGIRAVGNEPGWHVEVDLGEAPRMRLVLEYGERELSVERSERFVDGDGSSGFRGEVDGEPVGLTIRREECIDPMSGEGFDASATLEFEGERYEACGRFLAD